MKRWLPPVLGLALLVPVLNGCGYRAGGPFRDTVHTVHVEMFSSKTFRRDLEFRLTEAVEKRIAMDTPYRVVSAEKADTILMAEILEERQAAMAPDFLSRQPRDMQLTLAVRVQWKDLRTGALLVPDRPIIQAVDYLPPTGESEYLAQDRAIDRLAARIVAQLAEDF